MGAYSPVDHSVTKHFYDRGWHGINIEPNPAPFAELQAVRERDINLNIGVSDHAGEMTILEAPGACWSVDREMLKGYFNASESQIIEHSISVRTLAEICDEYVPTGTAIDFLKIDVEGHEGAVFRGGDWERHRPRVIVVEAMGFEEWEPLLLASGYHFALFEGVNRVYVRDEDARLVPVLSYPANVSDSFEIYGYIRRIRELERIEEALLRANADQSAEIGGLKAKFGHLGSTALRMANRVERTAQRYRSTKQFARKMTDQWRRRGA